MQDPQFSPGNFEPGKQQSDALDLLTDWWRSINRKQVFKLSGFAGTGKTTLAKEITRRLKIKAAYAAYTGIASRQMGLAGCKGAKTIHKSIYLPQLPADVQAEKDELFQEVLRSDGYEEAIDQANELQAELMQGRSYEWKVTPSGRVIDCNVIIIDECSMVDEKIAKDLESLGKPIIVLGDPFQLPPVQGTGYYTSNPDVMLTEIHRQAENNPIIKLSMIVRNMEMPKCGEYGDSLVKRGNPWGVRHKPEIGMNICNNNNTRQQGNASIRRQIWGENCQLLPVVGDRLICERNETQHGLVNGSTVIVTKHINGMRYEVEDEHDGHKVVLNMQEQIFHGDKKDPHAKEYVPFDYAYMITCHKAQGSQANIVRIFDEKSGWGSCKDNVWIPDPRAWNEEAFRWRYTAITRAINSLIWIIK